MNKTDKKFAILIDADNISSKKIKPVLDEIANYGIPTIKRIYGDFTNSKLAAWKDTLLENSIIPIQQYAYTAGKNATDAALIIDAMDLLHKEAVDGFCIVSSDSDFTRLASRLRESGKEVLGFGEQKTPQPFVKSCDKFTYVEILGSETPAEETPQPQPTPSKTVKNSTKPASATTKEKPAADTTPLGIRSIDKKLKTLVRNAIDAVADDTGWVSLGMIGNLISKKMPDFDSRNYGYTKLSSLMKALGDVVETKTQQTKGQDSKQIYIRNKK